MGMIRILRNNEDALIAMLKRIRSGKWRLLIYLYYLPGGLLLLLLGVISIPLVVIVCFVLLYSLFKQGVSLPLSKVLDGILAITVLSFAGFTSIHTCARVMYHMMRRKRDEAP